MVLSSSSGGVTFLLKKMILGNLNLTGSEHMICEFQTQYELDYADRRKSIHEKNTSTALDNTTDDIQEARDDYGGDDARALQEMMVLNNRGLAKETRGASSVSSTHESIKSARKSVREDLELRWVTNLSEERKRFYLIGTLLDPHTKILSFCDNQYFSSSWKDEGHAFLSMEFETFDMESTQASRRSQSC
jgi:hypothetical protein